MKSIKNLAKIVFLAGLGNLASFTGCAKQKIDDLSKYSCDNLRIGLTIISFKDSQGVANYCTYKGHRLSTFHVNGLNNIYDYFSFDKEDSTVNGYGGWYIVDNREYFKRTEAFYYSDSFNKKIWEAIKDSVQIQANKYLNQILEYKQTKEAKEDSLKNTKTRKEISKTLEVLRN